MSCSPRVDHEERFLIKNFIESDYREFVGQKKRGRDADGGQGAA